MISMGVTLGNATTLSQSNAVASSRRTAPPPGTFSGNAMIASAVRFGSHISALASSHADSAKARAATNPTRVHPIAAGPPTQFDRL